MTLPPGFESQLSFLATEDLAQLKQSIAGTPITSLRVNPNKWDQSVDLEKVPWSVGGYYLQDRPMFTCDPLLHAGAYYVQEASSMVIGHILQLLMEDMEEAALVLDLCAAPGGKSTDIMANLRAEDVLLSNEVIQSRAKTLRENVTKWGGANHLVSSNDPADFRRLPGLFDVMLIDAPCSGEGLFRKDPEAVNEWSPEAVDLCQKRQQRILADAWPCLAADGILIYATCTYNEAENEAVLCWLKRTYEVSPMTFSLETLGFQVSEVDGFPLYKAFPHRLKGEGFSFFVVRKKEVEESVTIRSGRKKKDSRKRMPIDAYLKQPETDGFVQDSSLLYFEDLPLRDLLNSHLHLLKSGLRIGEIKKNKLVPDHELAMSTHFHTGQYPEIELDYPQAIQYLRKESFELKAEVRGIHLVRYRGVGLGFINHLGNRFNSLYPAGYRIRTQACDGEPGILCSGT